MSPHAKHTPGPWSVSHDGYYPVVIKRFRPDHHMQVCGPVHGYMYSPDEKGEQIANAHLIAASPALFEALKAQEEADMAQQALEAHAFATVAEQGLDPDDASLSENKRLRALRDELKAKAKALRTAALTAAQPEAPAE